MTIQSVKKKSRRFLKNPEISDYTDYETITLIRKKLKVKKNLCNRSWNLRNQETVN